MFVYLDSSIALSVNGLTTRNSEVIWLMDTREIIDVLLPGVFI